ARRRSRVEGLPPDARVDHLRQHGRQDDHPGGNTDPGPGIVQKSILLRPAKPSSGPWYHSTAGSPTRQQSSTSSPSRKEGKSSRPLSASLRSTPIRVSSSTTSCNSRESFANSGVR